MKLVGWITFSRRLLWNQRREDERRARDQLRPLGNVKKAEQK